MQQWHALGKLRLHSEKTLKVFEDSTKTLAATVRDFQRTTCETYMTRELPSEEAARGRRQAATAARRSTKRQKTGKTTTKDRVSDSVGDMSKASQGRKRKDLNLETYKWHAFADYTRSIREYGTTDNTTTQVVSCLLSYLLSHTLTVPQSELEHRRPKKHYGRSKKQNHAVEIAIQQAREREVRKIRRRVLHLKSQKSHKRTKAQPTQFVVNDPLPYSIPSHHHHISEGDRDFEEVIDFVANRSEDPAVQVRVCFIYKPFVAHGDLHHQFCRTSFLA